MTGGFKNAVTFKGGGIWNQVGRDMKGDLRL